MIVKNEEVRREKGDVRRQTSNGRRETGDGRRETGVMICDWPQSLGIDWRSLIYFKTCPL